MKDLNRFFAVRPLALLRRARRLFVAAAFYGGFLVHSAPASSAPWLFVSDIHFDPSAGGAATSTYGSDTNFALLRSSIAEMKRADPAAPVIVIAGDFLAHHFDSALAASTMATLAQRFNKAFPNAQFVIALGNEDSACGDYRMSAKAPFLRAVAVAWEPLVNRRGAAPSFVRTFSRDGFYSTALPLPHLKAIVIDDVFWSPRYRACGGSSAAALTSADLRRALGEEPLDKKWVIAHIPPGIDAYSTAHLVHRLLVVPFLNPDQREQLLTLVEDPHSHVAVVLSAHTHKFAFRIAGETPSSAVPILLIPSVSPIFRNAPSFLTVDVGTNGTIKNADDHALLDGHWQTIGGTRTLGLPAVSGAALLALQERLARDAEVRLRFARLYNSGAPPEVDERNWKIYRCAATEFGATAFRKCLGKGGFSLLTDRGIALLAIVGSIVITALVAGGLLVRRYRRA